MDAIELQEKMDPTHLMYFRRMLKMKELPVCLLEAYHRVKLLTDRIDSSVSVSILATIALNAGFNPETGEFEVTEQVVEKLKAQLAETTEGEDARLQAEADETAKPVEVLDEADDQMIEQTLDHTVDQSQEMPAAPLTVEQAAQSNRKDMLWSAGMPVTVLHGEELKQGRIFAVHPPEPGSEKPVELTVEVKGGETITIDEDKVEAV